MSEKIPQGHNSGQVIDVENLDNPENTESVVPSFNPAGEYATVTSFNGEAVSSDAHEFSIDGKTEYTLTNSELSPEQEKAVEDFLVDDKFFRSVKEIPEDPKSPSPPLKEAKRLSLLSVLGTALVAAGVYGHSGDVSAGGWGEHHGDRHENVGKNFGHQLRRGFEQGVNDAGRDLRHQVRVIVRGTINDSVQEAYGQISDVVPPQEEVYVVQQPQYEIPRVVYGRPRMHEQPPVVVYQQPQTGYGHYGHRDSQEHLNLERQLVAQESNLKALVRQRDGAVKNMKVARSQQEYDNYKAQYDYTIISIKEAQNAIIKTEDTLKITP